MAIEILKIKIYNIKNMDNAQKQLAEKLQTATNILVTVSRDPSVDQLAACVGLTLLLNKFGKHATAVFSGKIPSTLEFLQPDQTLEKNTDSLRDFIIALDKTKADKLRYKVEDDMVRIFITPYQTSISEKDLEFSQGDFNVDVVIALGVSRQEDFDDAITAHGRILHDAIVSSISTSGAADLGSINWSAPSASSLSELVVALAHTLGDNLLDAQVATALLTGIVSETARFSNEKTTPQTMSLSAELMAAGANQQLVATKLSESLVPAPAAAPKTEVPLTKSDQPVATDDNNQKTADGTLEINHDNVEDLPDAASEPSAELPPPADDLQELDSASQSVHQVGKTIAPPADKSSSRLIVDPPTLGGTLTANSQPEALDPPNDIFGLQNGPQPALLNRQEPSPQPTPDPAPTPPLPTPPELPSARDFTPPPPDWSPAPKPTDKLNVDTTRTLSEIEAAVYSSEQPQEESLDDARDEVMRALNSQPASPEPLQALGAQPLGEPLRANDIAADGQPQNPAFSEVLNQVIPPSGSASTVAPPAPPAPQPIVNDPTAPPPVPPPIPFNFSPLPPPPQQ